MPFICLQLQLLSGVQPASNNSGDSNLCSFVPVTSKVLICVVRASIGLAGTSAGGIVAVAARCGIPFTEVLKALEAASRDLLDHGFKQRIRSVLQPVLERLLPADAHERCNRSPAVTLTASRIKGPCPACWRGQLLNEPFSSREDLVQRLLVAIHEPRETDGRLCVRYNRHYYADGGTVTVGS